MSINELTITEREILRVLDTRLCGKRFWEIRDSLIETNTVARHDNESTVHALVCLMQLGLITCVVYSRPVWRGTIIYSLTPNGWLMLRAVEEEQQRADRRVDKR
jgi:hypothetical protein